MFWHRKYDFSSQLYKLLFHCLKFIKFEENGVVPTQNALAFLGDDDDDVDREGRESHIVSAT